MALRWVLATMLLGCGAKSGLTVDDDAVADVDSGVATDGLVPAGDSGRGSDAGIPLPCFETLPLGEVRGDLGPVTSRVVFDEAGNLYATRTVGDVAELVRWTPCLDEAWSVRVPIDPREMLSFVKVGPSGAIHVTLPGQRAVVSPSGERLPDLVEPSRPTVDLIATRPYPITLSRGGIGATVVLGGHPPDAPPIEAVAGIVGDIAPDYGSCLVVRELIACAEGTLGLRVRDLSTVYTRPHAEWSLRSAQPPPATDGERLFVPVVFETSLELRALAAATGEVVWVSPLEAPADAPPGALVASAPIVVEDRVLVFHTAPGPMAVGGRLDAFDRDGALRWSYPVASAPPRVTFPFYPSTLVFGDAGVVYLATGEELHAVDLTGAARWRAPLPAAASGDMNLSPLGDVVVRTTDGNVLVVATESSGPAPGGWPMLGHDPQATFAFEP